MFRNLHMWFTKVPLSLFIGSILFTSLSLAQLTQSTLKGTVADATGAMLAHASVVATNEGTGQSRTTTSDSDGVFSLPDLPSGFYTVTVSIAGFKTYEHRGLELSVGKMTEIDARLELGQIKETVEVSAQAAKVPVSTEGRLSDTFQTNQITDLPIPQRDVFFLPSLSAGATNIPGAAYSYKLTNSPAVTVNGNRYRGNNYVLDGSMDTFTYNQGEPSIVPSLESLAEVQVQTGNFSSEYGRGNGSVVNMRTKSGSNQFHGNLWEYHKNAALNARNFFAVTTPPLVFNQFGANFGGPIIRNKTFFFGSYEGMRDALGQAQAFQVETPEFRNYVLTTDHSSVAASLLQQFPAPTPRPGSNGKEYQGEVDITTPQGAVIPGLGTAQDIIRDDLRSDQYLARLDHTLGSRDTLTGRWISEYERSNGSILTGAPASSLAEAMRGFHEPFNGFFGNLNIGEVHALNHVVNDARFSGTDEIIGYTRPFSQFPTINITGVTAPFGDPGILGERFRVYEGRDTVDLSFGKHIVRTGGEARKLFMGENRGVPTAGSYYFNNLLNFAADKPYEQVRIVNPATGQPTLTQRNFTIYEAGLFVQDDWKATSRLTLNIGVREDYFGSPSERNGLLSNLIWGPGSSFDERFASASVGHVSQLYATQKLNLSPRLGLAYDPFGDGKSSIRAGYSIAFEPPHGKTIVNGTSNPPYAIQAILEPSVGIGTTIDYGIPVPFNPQFQTALNAQGGVVATPGKAPIRISPWLINPNLKSQYSESWFFNLEREVTHNWIMEVGYVGTNGINLERRDDINRFDGDLRDGVLNRINPNFGGVSYATNGVTSSYNAMTVEVRHRVGKGLTVQANYRWSKWLDDSSDTATSSFPDDTEVSKGAENANCLKCERGRSIFDIPQRFTASVVWTSRVNHGPSFAQKLGDNWQISTIIVAQSGRPFGVYCAASRQAGCDWNEDGGGAISSGYYDRPNAPAPGAVKSSFGKQDFLNGLFNPNIFPAPALGTDGNLGRDVYRGPQQFNADLALARGFKVQEGKELQIRLEAFNTLNNVNLYLPNSDMSLALTPSGTFSSSSSFAKSTQAFDPRILQVSARFVF